MTSGPREWTIGRSTFRFEPPDLLWATMEGDSTEEDAVLLVELFRELGSVRPFFLVGDMKKSHRVAPELQRYLVEHIDNAWFLAIIYLEARLVHRALAKGITLAMQLNAGADFKHPDVHFVAGKAQAEVLLTRLRARLADDKT